METIKLLATSSRWLRVMQWQLRGTRLNKKMWEIRRPHKFSGCLGGRPQCRSICYTTVPTICTNEPFQPHVIISKSHISWFCYTSICYTSICYKTVPTICRPTTPQVKPLFNPMSVSANLTSLDFVIRPSVKHPCVIQPWPLFASTMPQVEPFQPYVSISKSHTSWFCVCVFFFNKWLMSGAVEEKAPQGIPVA